MSKLLSILGPRPAGPSPRAAGARPRLARLRIPSNLTKALGFETYIKRLSLINRAGFTSSVALFIISLLIIFPIYYKTNLAEAAGNLSDTTLSITSDNLTAGVDLLVTSDSGTFASSTSPMSFSVTTNNVTGYMLSISAKSGTDLTNSTAGTSFTSLDSTNTTIAAGITADTFGNASNTVYNNQWGFKPSYYKSSANSDKFYPSPTTSGVVLNKTTCANNTASSDSLLCQAASNTYTIAIGTRATYAQVAGTYSNTYILNSVGNYPSYKITYNDASGDSSVSTLPATQSANNTTSASVTLSSDIPTRTGYTFNRWCIHDNSTNTNKCPSTDNGNDDNGTVANGGAYNPGDTYSISTINSNTIALYAVWTPNTYTVNFYSNPYQVSGKPLVVTLNGRTYTKTNAGNALVASTFGGIYTGPVIVSQDKNATIYTTGGDWFVTEDGPNETISYDGLSYYYSSDSAWMAGDITSAAGVATKKYSNLNYIQAAAQLLADSKADLKTQSFTYDAYQNLSANTYTRNGYTFKGWSTTPTGNVIYTNSESVKNLATSGTVNLYAIWEDAQYSCIRQYRLQYADGTFAHYYIIEAQQVNYGDTCTYAKSVDGYKGSASGTNNETVTRTATVTTAGDNATLSIDFYRNTYTLTVNRDTNHISSVSGGGTYRWGQSASISATAATGHSFTSWSQTSGTAGSFGNSGSASTTFVMPTSDATVYANGQTNSYLQTTQVRYENADGSWGNYSVAESRNVSYGSSYSWSTSQISGFDSTVYQAASVASYTVTGANTNWVSIYRNTFGVDINPVIDGVTQYAGLSGFTFDGYINGVLTADDVIDWYPYVRYGSTVRVVANAVSGYNITADGDTTRTVTSNLSLSIPTWTKAAPGYCSSTDSCMQTYTLAMCQAGASSGNVTLTDARDGKTYTVRYINGQCWMTKSLDLSGGATLTSADSNVSNSYILPLSSNINVGYNSAAVYNSGSIECTSEKACFSYYNYAAATAGSDPSSGDATVDICPLGWRLPTKTEYEALKNQYGYYDASTMLLSGEWSAVLSGYYRGILYQGGQGGHYWSSTAENEYWAYYLNVAYYTYPASVVYSQDFEGRAVRCIAKN